MRLSWRPSRSFVKSSLLIETSDRSLGVKDSLEFDNLENEYASDIRLLDSGAAQPGQQMIAIRWFTGLPVLMFVSLLVMCSFTGLKQSSRGNIVSHAMIGQQEVFSRAPRVVLLATRSDGCLSNTGVSVDISECNVSLSHQHWVLDNYPGMIRNGNGGCLDAGGHLHVWPCDKANSQQQWSVHEDSGLIKIGDGSCLDGQDSASVRTCDLMNPDQFWILRPLANTHWHVPEMHMQTTTVTTTLFELAVFIQPRIVQVRKTISECLAVDGDSLGLGQSTLKSGSVLLAPCDTSDLRQYWIQERSPGPLCNAHGGCLDAEGSLHTQPCNRSNQNQLWVVQGSRGVVVAIGQENCLTAGENLTTERCDTNDLNQSWMIEQLIPTSSQPPNGTLSSAVSIARTVREMKTECDAECILQGENGTCRSHINQFSFADDCAAAARYVLEHCPTCSRCRRDTSGCPRLADIVAG